MSKYEWKNSEVKNTNPTKTFDNKMLFTPQCKTSIIRTSDGKNFRVFSPKKFAFGLNISNNAKEKQ